MITNNKEEFMNSVEMIASKYRERSFEALLNGFMKSIIKKSISLEVPKTLNFDDKKSLGESINSIIEKSSKQFVQNGLVNESGALFDVNFAHEIVNPSNFNESVQKLIAEHIYEESKDRATVLEAEFEAGKINNMTSEEAVNYIETAFSNEAFDTKFINGESLKSSLHHLMSIEGEELIESIKADVHKLVNETEAKNSVIREAVSEINDTKAKIEEKINGEAESIGEDKEENNNTEESSNIDNMNSEDTNTTSDNSSVPNENGESDSFSAAEEAVDQATESYKRRDFYTIIDNSPINLAFSGEEYIRNYDEDSFSREAADDILKEFRELDDGINTDTLGNDPEMLSVGENSDNCGPDCVTGGSETNSTENEYYDDNDEPIEIDPEKFQYEEIQPDELSGEALAKEFIPLSLRKIGKRTIHINKKLPLLLALNGERSEEFFNICRNRVEMVHEMLSKEDAVIEDMAKDDINKKLELTVDSIEKIKNDKDIIMNNLGILGILDGKYQRSNDPIENAVKSLVKPQILKPMSEKDADVNTKDISIEAYEHELAETLKIAMKMSECKNEIAKGANIIGNKEQLGYLEELLNEKMFNIPKTDTDKMNLEEKINALQSIESMVGLKEAVNLQAFISKTAENNRDRVVLESLKDIDGYGYSYIDEVNKIKSSINTKFKDQFKSSGKKLTNYNFDINELVDFVLEEQDTTKLKSNLFEQVLSKLSNQNEITNSTEGIKLYNRAKAITSGYVAATKLGFLRESDKQDIKNYLI